MHCYQKLHNIHRQNAEKLIDALCHQPPCKNARGAPFGVVGLISHNPIACVKIFYADWIPDNQGINHIM